MSYCRRSGKLLHPYLLDARYPTRCPHEIKEETSGELIVCLDDKEHPGFFVANYRHIKEKFGHLALYAMMERAGVN